MEKNLQEFIAEEKKENNGIDQQESEQLDNLIHNNQKELKEEVKNIFTDSNIKFIVEQINKFLQSENGKKIDSASEEHYINILNTLQIMSKNVNLKGDKDKKGYIKETKDLLSESKVSNQLTKSLFDKITDKNGQQINGLDAGNLSYMINNFIAQYNTHNTENKITNKLFGQEDLYKLPTARKDAFATKLAQMTFRVEQNNNKRNGTTNQAIEQAIRNYRQEFFNKCFKDGEVIPPLLKQKNILLGDQKGNTTGILYSETENFKDPKTGTITDGRIPAEEIVNIAGYRYSNDIYKSNNNTISREKEQETLDLAVLADGIDRGGVDINVKIDNTILKGHTKGIFPDKVTRDLFIKSTQAEKDAIVKKLSDEDKKNRTLIIWDNPEQLPKGVSLNTGGVHIDAKTFGSKPQVSLDIVSPEKNDETFVTINTNGSFNDKPIAGQTNTDIMQQNLFENGSHIIKEAEAAKLNSEITDIKKIIKEGRIAKGNTLLLNVDSTTDKSQIVDSLHTTLKKDLVDLQKSFLTLLETKYGKEQGGQKFAEVQSAIALKVKNRSDSDGNKVLAQCRAYEGMQYMLNNLGDENLNKVAFNINNIQGDQPQRSFSIYTRGESIKTPEKSATN